MVLRGAKLDKPVEEALKQIEEKKYYEFSEKNKHGKPADGGRKRRAKNFCIFNSEL